MVRAKTFGVVAALGLAVAASFGDDGRPVDPWSFKSHRAVRARAEFDEAVARADADADAIKAAARDRLGRVLAVAEADATRDGDGDDAAKIRAAARAVKDQELVPHSASDLDRQLIGTRWRMNKVELRFDRGGTYAFADWGTARGTYRAVTGQTISCVDREGKPVEFTVTPDLSLMYAAHGGSFTGWAERVRE